MEKVNWDGLGKFFEQDDEEDRQTKALIDKCIDWHNENPNGDRPLFRFSPDENEHLLTPFNREAKDLRACLDEFWHDDLDLQTSMAIMEYLIIRDYGLDHFYEKMRSKLSSSQENTPAPFL